MQDDGADAGAAHGDEARLQTEVVTVPRPFLRADLAQQQHLAHDGFGLQAQVLLALRVQTALEQAAGLRQPWEERGVVGDAAQRAEEQKPVSECVSTLATYPNPHSTSKEDSLAGPHKF